MPSSQTQGILRPVSAAIRSHALHERLTYIIALGETAWPKVLMGNETKPADLLQGTLELLILRTLASGEKHGYEIAEWIHAASAEALAIEEGALYPALHRLELRGLLTAEWDVSANNRRAKYYRLTASGRKRLKEATDSWRRTSTAINLVLEAG
jgi:PadR family transcriptional regulator, regulatory protein PadR